MDARCVSCHAHGGNSYGPGKTDEEFAVVDFATRTELRRVELSEVAGKKKETEVLQLRSILSP
jgi:hypothetical protein